MTRFAALRTSIVAAAALALSACGINSVPTAEENAKAKWADVEAAFQERANLVPNLEQIVMSSAEQERKRRGSDPAVPPPHGRKSSSTATISRTLKQWRSTSRRRTASAARCRGGSSRWGGIPNIAATKN